MRNVALLQSLTFCGALALPLACSSLEDDYSGRAEGGSGAGASSTGGEGAGGGGGTGGGTPAGCVPELAGGPVGDDCGVFVAQGAGGGSGTKDSPVGSVAAALAMGKSRIYLCAETFVEAVALPAGTSIYGGLDCQSDWSWSGSDKSGIEGPADAIALTISGSGSSTVADVTVTAVDAVAAGASSIAALVDGSTVDFVRVDLVAGAGMAGDDGEVHTDAQAPNGSGGLAGTNDSGGACNTTQIPIAGGLGGEAVVCPAGVDSGKGGNGGNGTNAATGDPGAGGEPSDAVWGLGGSGEGDPPPCTGGEGKLGDSGPVPASGVSGLGGLTATGYEPPLSVNGGHGQPGQGAGGGGGANTCLNGSSQPRTGPSGGGGGSGGCGGLGGNGGQSGGSSIALISLDAMVTLSASTLSAASGGDGGAGEIGQQGGNGGGPGSSGGSGSCFGGQGGSGGRGAPGGGGLGGHSLGIAFTGTAPSYEPTDVTISVASTSAAGGIGATDGVLGKAGDGDPGLALEAQSFD